MVCALLLLLVAGVQFSDACFSFTGDSYLRFSPHRLFNNDGNLHYELEFRTNHYNGVILYAHGQEDVESLFVKEGRLHYLLFNQAPSGVGGQFGAYFQSVERVDNYEWIKVHMYRSYLMRDRHFRPIYNKTGIEFELEGELRSYVDRQNRDGVNISPDIYIGGFRTSLGGTVGNFTGQIRHIQEETNSHQFENPALNYRSLVDLSCGPNVE